MGNKWISQYIKFKEDNIIAITRIGSNYNVYESTYIAQKNEAAKEVNANGLGIRGNGMLSHISQMMVHRAENWMNGIGETNDILGKTVQSAIMATKQALYNLDHPLAPAYRTIEAEQARIKEREFYTAFLEKLENL